jgi:hypothetical protein
MLILAIFSKSSGAHLLERLHLNDACVIDDDVEAAQFARSGRNGLEDLVAVADVDARHHAPAAEGADLLGDLGGRSLVQIGDADIGAVPRQPKGNRPTDPLSAAGDQGHLAVDTHIVSSRGHGPHTWPVAVTAVRRANASRGMGRWCSRRSRSVWSSR